MSRDDTDEGLDLMSAGAEPIYFDLIDTDKAALDHLANLCISLTGTYDNAKVRRLALSVPALIAEIRRLRSLVEGGEQTTEWGALRQDGTVYRTPWDECEREVCAELQAKGTHTLVQRTILTSPWSPADSTERETDDE